ncbi:MAG: HlyD family efflux transporter periplasmic adaptor subunit [Gammaproteobacteria bacterium]|nr:HlyD family efflux transporter periplasmic adaptor subunit [Gammaproteobacteria bacterium]
MIKQRAKSQQHAVLQLMQWSGVWIEDLVQNSYASQSGYVAFGSNLIRDTLGRQYVRLAAMEVVNQLADRFECDRVSLGLRKGLQVSLQAISRMAHFDSRTQLVRRIEAALEETIDQAASIIEPVSPEHASVQRSVISRANKELAGHHGRGAVCSIPLPGCSGYVGAITLERSADNPFDDEIVSECETLVGMLGPVLEMKQREEQSFVHKSGGAIKTLLTMLFGKAHLKQKFLLFTVLALFTIISVVEGDYRVTAPAGIEGEVRQVLVAQQSGYVFQAKARAGDLVEKNQLIALLDDRDLQLEYKKLQSEKNKIETEYQDALAKWDRTELSILRSKIEQFDAELRLIKGNLARTKLYAPFDGIVVSGDLSQFLGAPVEIGQTLFEIAPLDSYRVIIEVDEHDMANIEVGKPGKLVITAFPQQVFAITTRQIVPMADASEGRNYFRVEATLDEPSKQLLPGMHGVAKIEAGSHKLLWNWTHSAVDRLKLWAWSMGF